MWTYLTFASKKLAQKGIFFYQVRTEQDITGILAPTPLVGMIAIYQNAFPWAKDCSRRANEVKLSEDEADDVEEKS